MAALPISAEYFVKDLLKAAPPGRPTNFNWNLIVFYSPMSRLFSGG
jgi:hypothetical protein